MRIDGTRCCSGRGKRRVSCFFVVVVFVRTQFLLTEFLHITNVGQHVARKVNSTTPGTEMCNGKVTSSSVTASYRPR